MARIPQEIIDRIIDALDIVAVISEYVQLKRVGRNFKACCPFHNEKTPSFVVSPEKQIYHCFGCASGGNAIGFIMQHENISFPEAVEKAAARAGVELPRYTGEEKRETSLAGQIYEVNKTAAVFYQNYLRGEKGRAALEYLKKRGFTGETITKFKIGYAPDEWEDLKKFCVKKGISGELLRKAGLTISSEKGKGDYDRFRNRIIFPIFNERDVILGFGGRVMDDSLPKYINSPETAVYTKGNVLYGLNFSKRGIREKGFVVIAEGYMDVAIPNQYGIDNVVAASGTALTSKQIKSLEKYTDTVVMVFDADQAGEAASLRGLDLLIEEGMKVRIAALPEGDDPDSFVRKKGPEGFKNILEKAKDLFDYKLDLLIKRLGKKDIGGISEEMLPTISRVKNMVVKSGYLKALAERLDVNEDSLRHEISKVQNDGAYRYEEKKKEDGSFGQCRNSELHILGLAMYGKTECDRIKKELGFENLKNVYIRNTLERIESIFEKGEKDLNPGKLIGYFEEQREVKQLIASAVAKTEITQDPGKALTDCIACVKKENRDEELKDLSRRLKESHKNKDNEESSRLLSKIDGIHKKKVA
ncbi:MAG: DNA primase [Candidatus Omnitrophota bacterium]|nr:DNA primase [Candidatus Omnitrophota bacterium]